jgi:hypothetical protein
MSILKLAAKYCAATDPEIGSKIGMLPIQKSASNYVAADSEIGSLKLCRCRFRNRQPKALLLLILKLATKYCAAIEKSTAKTVPLPIQKSTATVESF